MFSINDRILGRINNVMKLCLLIFANAGAVRFSNALIKYVTENLNCYQYYKNMLRNLFSISNNDFGEKFSFEIICYVLRNVRLKSIRKSPHFNLN
uniref:Uncharacterized protein n=1 Tax=Rhizophagus irregularis (strain DAOM 181602 / DAOM 197198 / MUCL 43194) TaxID=747089 RepID=U9TT44_RHIID